MYGKDLISELKSELSGDLENTVLALLQCSEIYDARSLHNAIARLGTNEETLIEIICSRSNAESQKIKLAYKHLYQTDLEKDVIRDTSGYFKRVLVACLTGGRREDLLVDFAQAEADAKALEQAGLARGWSTDEGTFIAIFAARSHAQLNASFKAFKRLTKLDITKVISDEMSGYLENTFLTISENYSVFHKQLPDERRITDYDLSNDNRGDYGRKVVKNKHGYFAERLFDSMIGAGTNDKPLIRIIVSRCEKDSGNIKQVFLSLYGKTLESFITGDCSGDYKRILLALINPKPGH